MIYRKKQYLGTEEEKLSSDIIYTDNGILTTDLEAIYEQIPTATVTGNPIYVTDSSSMATKEKDLLGNATQDGTPTPDAPVDINVVTGDVTYTQYGKNLIDNTNFNYIYTNVTAALNTLTTIPTGIRYNCNRDSSGTFVVMFNLMKLNLLKSKTIKMKSNFTTKGSIRMMSADSSGNNRTALAESITSGTEISYTVPNDVADNLYLGFQLVITGDSDIRTVDFTNLIMTIESDTTYEPYVGATKTLPLGTLELAGIGDYKDKLFHAVEGNSIYDSLDSTTKASLNVGGWYKQGNIKKLILDGVSALFIGTFADNNRGTLAISDTRLVAYNVQNALMNKFSFDTSVYYDSLDNVGFCPRNNNSGYFIRFGSESNITTKEKANTWLQEQSALGTPATVYYQLETPTYTEITDTSLINALNEWEQMNTYKNDTNAWIEPTGTNESGTMQIVYRKDLSTLFNNLNSAILSLGGNV